MSGPNNDRPHLKAADDELAALRNFAERGRAFLGRWRVALIALVGLAQAGVLVFMVADREVLLAGGRNVDFQVQPVDPRELFRGDYVTLGYDITRVPRSLVAGELRRGDKIFVRLAKTGNVWAPAAVGRSIGEARDGNEDAPGEVTLAGRVQYATASEASAITVGYGIEKFFVPEGAGGAIEKQVREKTVVAHVAVANDGTAALRGLTVDGRRYDMPPLF